MRGHRFWVLQALCAAFCVVFIVGCAGKQSAKSFIPPAGNAAGIWMFRHAATLELPGAGLTLPFTGAMRVDTDAGEAHAVVLSTMGMTLLDITVDPTGYTTRFVHPSLSRLPHAARNAAAAIRFLWLGKIVPDGSASVDATVLAEGLRNGWAENVTLNGTGFVLRVTLVESRQETK